MREFILNAKRNFARRKRYKDKSVILFYFFYLLGEYIYPSIYNFIVHIILYNNNLSFILMSQLVLDQIGPIAI